MLSLRLLLAGCLLAMNTTGCRDACVSTCQLRAKELGCAHADQCRDSCEKLRTSPVCQTEFKAFKACFLKQPRTGWECDDSGLPVMTENACLTEKLGVNDCLVQSPPPPPTPPSR
jgi:hypothetical protein